uniref:SEC16 homolog B, endoplasmic reticulum export factor n=1 Tax=Mandrillus leucophaeus TaxID=9568 RepID=A0A2K6AFZ1_MANLE
MELWAPQRLPQTRGTVTAPSKDPDRGFRRDGHHRPVPHSRHNGERFHQWQDNRGSPQPQQEPRTDHQQSHYASRPGDWHQPLSRIDYYESGYPSQLYSRPGYENSYQGYHSPTTREEYAYGSYYYHGHPQWLQEERVPRQRSPYIWHEDYREQKYLDEHHYENQHSPFGTNSETHFQSNSRNPYKDSPASNSGQEWPGELFPGSLLAGAQKTKPSLASESNLLQQRESGLSSSSYELSQYITDASERDDPPASAAWSPVQAEDVSSAGPKAPMKFYVPHVPVSFGPGGQLVCVGPSSPTDGQAALVELHSMEVILNDSKEQEEMRSFSGPLIREDIHKVDIMTFCQQKAAQSCKSETLGSRDSALLWQLLVLLCRQNGSMVGSDIAELLMQDCKKLEKYKRQPPVANLISLTDEDWPVLSSGTPNLLTGEIPPSVETPAQIVEKFTRLLYYGRKKEALEWAMKNHLWGHALFLSSKMDPRTYSWVMSGFTSTLALNDPLQTLFQLMSGRIPQAATCCGEKQWGDWRPHLAVILSNQAGDPELYQRAIVAMGDTLGKRYHTLSRRELMFVYKLLYASRLADYGLVSQALHYCEAIGAAVLSQGESSHPVLLAELIKLAEKLKLSDPLVLERRSRDRDLEPDWLVQLRRQLEQKIAGDTGDPHLTRSDISGARGTTTENTFYQDFSGFQGYSEAPGYRSALWLTLEQTCLPQPSPQQPFPLQPGSYPAGGGAGQTGAPMPLYSVPEIHLPGTGSSVAVTEAPGRTVWEEPLQTHLGPGENTVSQETSQPPDGQEVISKPQTPLAARAPSISESSTNSTKEDEEESSDEADKNSPQNTARRGKLGDGKEHTKSSGFGWFSWFRSKPTKNASPSGEEDSSDSPDCERETPRASSPHQAGLGLSLTPSPESPPLPTLSAFSVGTGGGEGQGSTSSGGAAAGAGVGGLSGPESVSFELCSNPGVLLPPPALKGTVPLYNPSQVPQLPMATSLNRPNRLAQRRYPTQPC